MKKVLIIGPDREVAEGLQRVIDTNDVQIAIALAENIARTEVADFQVIIVDLDWHTKGIGRPDTTRALQIIEDLRRLHPHVPIIAMTTVPATDTTMDAIMGGAFDCIQKPTNEEQLKEFRLKLHKAIDLQEGNGTAIPSIPVQAVNGIVGRSPALQDVFRRIALTARTSQTVLIGGETGTGKELFARLIHDKSDRAQKPYVVIDCSRLPETLVETELFGQAKGAFTGAMMERKGKFEEAHGGTIFLDEIGELSLALQKKLLRVLQEKTVQRVGSNETIRLDVRVIAATNRDLKAAVRNKEFREDLYHRLRGTLIVLPPLRERKEDIPALISYFMEEEGLATHKAHPSISSRAIEFLQQQRWPGNIRQLKNVVRDALSRANGFGLTLDIVREVFTEIDDTEQKTPFEEALMQHVTELLAQAREGTLPSCYKVLVEDIARVLFKRAYDEAGNRIPATARLLGLSYPCTQKRLEHYGLLIEKNGSKKSPAPDVLKNGSNEMCNGHFKEAPEGHLNEVLEGHFETTAF